MAKLARKATKTALAVSVDANNISARRYVRDISAFNACRHDSKIT